MNTETSQSTDKAETVGKLRTELSVAKNLFFGEIVEENLFPYPQMRERDREMLGMMTDAIDRFLGDQAADLVEMDRIGEQPE